MLGRMSRVLAGVLGRLVRVAWILSWMLRGLTRVLRVVRGKPPMVMIKRNKRIRSAASQGIGVRRKVSWVRWRGSGN